MTTSLYHHEILGYKISSITSIDNIFYLEKEGSLYLYEKGIAVVDSYGKEIYVISIDKIRAIYIDILSIRNLKYSHSVIVTNHNLNSSKIRRNNYLKGGIIDRKLIINIKDLGTIVIVESASLRCKQFYDKLKELKKGNNPLDVKIGFENTVFSDMKSKFLRIFKR